MLGVSVRAVERYTTAGRLSVRYERGKTRSVAAYDEAEVGTLKSELENPAEVRPALVPATPTNADHMRQTPSHALQRAGDGQGIAMLVSTLADALQAAQGARLAVPAPALLMTEREAAAWLGVSKYQIARARIDGKLYARKIGRGWRVRPEDVLRLRDELFGAETDGGG